ncbi:hypothetical protein NEIELOOT_02639 [Neisseria elongata subsp. glycolytica ATCC 29315]|uniref:Uncharacterized protein n=1 Tax=Neisseria elongata subsp. glycolytica ATCC 29315 TaxID=546263 RepID=D4DU82_NEIEG|nr:hypothetical protein NEIELOOT_02639 [Neisseria elongata subsp. glycolytica ATCC 29315]
MGNFAKVSGRLKVKVYLSNGFGAVFHFVRTVKFLARHYFKICFV